MADQTLACLTTLLESVPRWVSELNGILASIAGKQKDTVSESRPPDSGCTFRRKLSKSSSLRSRRSEDEVQHALDPTPTSPPSLQPQLMGSDALRLSQRKRKLASVCSAEPSGPTKYRSRSTAVVYYDGDLQRQFEALVLAITASRNAVRKGTMGAKFDDLLDPGSDASSSGGEPGMRNSRRLTYKTARPRIGRNDGTQNFTKADALLDKAQAMCERAAHQVLRDGDCTLELNSAKERFTEAARLLEAETPALRKKADAAAERRRRSDHERRGEPDVIVHAPVLLSDDKLEADSESEGSGDEGGDVNPKMLQMSPNSKSMTISRLLAR